MTAHGDHAVGIISNVIISAAGQPMWLERVDPHGDVWLCCGCRLRVPAASEAHGVALLRRHRTTCGTTVLAATVDPARIESEIAAVRIELTRVDSKAAALLALAATGLTAGLAVLGSGRLNAPAVGVAWLAVACVALAVLLLGLAVRPRLGGDHGFMRWAAAGSAADLAADIATDPGTERAAHLCALSRTAKTKYRRIQGSIDLLGLGVLVAIAAAAINSQ